MVLMKERVGKLISVLEELIYSNVLPIPEYRILKTEEKIEDIENLDTSGWDVMSSRAIWGGHRERYYLETTVTVPEEYAGRTIVYELRTGREGDWDALNPQFMAYVNGHIKQGMDVNHRELLLTDAAQAGEQFRITLSAFTGDQNFFLLLDSEIKVLEREVEKYYYDISVPYNTARLLPKESTEYIEIIQCLNESLNLLDLRKPYSPEFYESLKTAQSYITEEFYEKRCGNSKETICCVGHTHIDCAWLWTLKVTEDKAARSFSTVLELMKRYPEYKFMSSQPQLYKYVKQNEPELYEEIKERVAEGRWETEGGTWVEPDCNLSSGESLVRQFIYGKRFFREEFGKDSEILWLPDVFGYSAALPQIMKKCGVNYFMTTKISWNEFNKMPYDTFLWEGIDGTTVLTHFAPPRDYGTAAKEDSMETEHFTTYNAMLNPSMTKGSWQRYSQKELHTAALMSYGFGDGGGGPTRDMLENGRRLEQGIPGCPRTVQMHAADFFHQLEKDVEGNRFLPKWVGELYLEYHRGTYTSMARNKKFNRKSEFAYENLEFYALLAGKLLGTEYPKELLREGWEVILRNQFHDILPGSSIKEVYEDSRAEYTKILADAAEASGAALQAVADAAEGAAGDLVVFNPNGVSAAAPVTIELEDTADTVGITDGEKEYLLQKTESGYVGILDPIPQKGYQSYQITGAKNTGTNPMIRSLTEVDTPYLHVTLNANGQFTSIYDKRNAREVIPAGGTANRIVTYEDRPHNYDNWDLNNYYTEKSWAVDDVSAIEITENGPVRACIRIERPYLDSVIAQYLYFYRDLARIDIRNEIDWRQDHLVMRDYFPVDVHTNEATFEIQYGNVKRPNHSNTMWDFAKFEVCAHKWLDVSEEGYGLSILNDCKYGCSVRGNLIGLTMLKCGTYPNEEADKEHHTFWYSICPHSGDYREAGTVADAYLFNNPPAAVQKKQGGTALPKVYSFASVKESNVVTEVVKQAEETEETVLRVYETDNRRGRLHIELAEQFEEAWETDMLENTRKPLTLEGHTLTAEILPYEIKTILLK